MSINFSLVSQEHRLACGVCRRSYDAMTAEWCRCVAKAPSPVCPSCGSCVCKQGRNAARDFWLAAPDALLRARDAEKQRRKNVASAQGAAAKVLIVDDDEEIRELAAWAVREIGYATATAPSVKEALDFLESERPAAVLTDALMPGGDGRELCRLIKERYPHVKVIVMTSLYTAPRYASEAHRLFHADGYLAKPIDFDRLRITLLRVLEVARAS
jgi:CheY-like chemotaxis protein